MPRTGRPPQPLGDPNATQLATAQVTFDEGGHVEAQWLNALADGQLAGPLRDEVLSHLASCDRCRKVIAELAQEATVRYQPGPATDLAVPSADLVGQRVGEYEVLEKLSEGGMGFVYRGVQPMIGKPVAIKVLQPEMAKDLENAHRLLAEARVVNAIRHPNIVDVFAFGNLPDGRQYFVMELLTGQNLATLVRSRPLELVEAVTVLEQVASALVAAHAAGVVHRDIKPSNVFVTPRAEELHVTVLDFGVAKGVARPLGEAVTLPGAIIGTPGFMAPEQVRGAQVGPATDLYSLGCAAWLMLARREVFSAEADVDLLRLHVEEPAPSISSVVQVPRELGELVDAMLAKEPRLRPSAAEARRALGRLRKELGPSSSGSTTVRRVRRLPDREPAPATIPVDLPAPEPAAAPPPTTLRELPAVQRGRRWPVLLGVLLALLGLGAAAAWKLMP